MNRSKSILATIFILFVFVTGVYAEEQAPVAAPAPATAAAPAAPAPDVTGSVSFAGLNKYIFRGAEISARSVVLEPSVTINYKGFSLNVWGNIDTDQHATQVFVPGKDGSGEGHKSFNETDLTLSYTYNIDKLALTGGYIYYGTEYAQQTQELYVSTTYDMIAHPTISIYRDIDANPGWYVNLSFSQSLPVAKMPNGDMTVDLGASFGYYNISSLTPANKTYSALHDGMVKVGLTVPVAKNVVVQPITQYWFPLSGKAHHDQLVTVDGSIFNNNPAAHIDNTFVFGVGATLSF
jgi:hypothetical protein